MRIDQLITELSKYPKDMQVRILGSRGCDTTEIVLRTETRYNGELKVLYITGE